MYTIEHFATGGTIDSQWRPEQDTAQVALQSNVEKYFSFMSGLGLEPIPSHTIMLKDSREVSFTDRSHIAAELSETSCKRILGTSGTYLMPDIARSVANHVMAQHFTAYNKRVVFTGALTPLDGFMMSDGGFNLGMATAVLQRDKIPGGHSVLATMNGVVVPGSAIEKDMTTATFAGRNEADDILGYRSLTVIPAGGTIDFEEDGLDGLQPASDSAVPSYLRTQVRMTKQIQAAAPILKDSRKLTPEDIDEVIDMIRSTTDECTLVTAGLVKIAELRNSIERGLSLADDGRKVVVTGSRYILRRAGHTDAPFNLGYALGVLGYVNPGVHTALAGRIISKDDDPLRYVFKPGELEKIRS